MTIAHQLKTRFNITSLQTDCIIGTDLLANLHKILSINKKDCNAFLILTDETVFNLFGKVVIESLTRLNKKVMISVIKSGEKQKDITVIPEIVKPFFDQGLDRNTCLVALGGGVVTDIGGFLASILLRGINLINIPTTLIGQVDAVVGGKNGVNFLSNNCMYKNILGTFKQPSIIISDVDTLSTLPEKEIINGLGEIVKYWIGWGRPNKSQISNLLPCWQTGKFQIDKKELLEIIKECQKIKIDIVSRDPFERQGLREKLNLGHTIGHAVEAVSNGRVTHGEAVSLGLVVAAKISLKMNILPPDQYQMIIDVITRMGLPISINNFEMDEVLSAIKMDKKGGTFVLIKDIGNLITNMKVRKKIITEVLSEVIVWKY